MANKEILFNNKYIFKLTEKKSSKLEMNLLVILAVII